MHFACSMEFRAFDDQKKVSVLGLGTWQFGGDWGEVQPEQAFAILQAALDGGVNFVDTADVYGLGTSERLIGEFMDSYSGPRPMVATKIGRFPQPGWPGNFEPSTMRKHIEASCERLRCQSLDLVQLHCIPTEELQKGVVFDQLRQLKSEGLIQRFGVSIESVHEGLLCLSQEGLASLQVIMNLFRQESLAELLPQAQAKGVAVIVRLPLASGLLSGTMTRDRVFLETDHRHYNRDGAAFNVGETFAGLPFDKALELVEELKTMVPSAEPLSALALRWCADTPGVTTVIPGATKLAQVRANREALRATSFSKAQRQQLFAFYQNQVRPHIRGPVES